jgi:hypothetical protein
MPGVVQAAGLQDATRSLVAWKKISSKYYTRYQRARILETLAEFVHLVF